MTSLLLFYFILFGEREDWLTEHYTDYPVFLVNDRYRYPNVASIQLHPRSMQHFRFERHRRRDCLRWKRDPQWSPLASRQNRQLREHCQHPPLRGMGRQGLQPGLNAQDHDPP